MTRLPDEYCPHDCTNGWAELESTYGTPCPIHPPKNPEPIAADDIAEALP